MARVSIENDIFEIMKAYNMIPTKTITITGWNGKCQPAHELMNRNLNFQGGIRIIDYTYYVIAKLYYLVTLYSFLILGKFQRNVYTFCKLHTNKWMMDIFMH